MTTLQSSLLQLRVDVAELWVPQGRCPQLSISMVYSIASNDHFETLEIWVSADAIQGDPFRGPRNEVFKGNNQVAVCLSPQWGEQVPWVMTQGPPGWSN